MKPKKLPEDHEGKSVMIIKGTPEMIYDAGLIDQAMDDAKRLAAENDTAYTLVITLNSGMVYEPIIYATTSEEYVRNKED